jgi:haloalkane dehalogenase
MKFQRTQDHRFSNLPGYPFAPHYLEIENPPGPPLRMHYVDEGPRDARPVLLLHGEPSWSYLYRNMIDPLVERGHRVLAPDLIGFGRSDKPAALGDYTFERHVNWMSSWLTLLNLNDITLFCQDWGGLIGLRLVTRFPERFAGVAVGNTGLPTGVEHIPRAFKLWLTFSRYSPWLPVSAIIDQGSVYKLSKDERRAYDAPFPSRKFKAGARQFPSLVPISRTHASVPENEEAWKVLRRFKKPFVTAFSTRDPITRGGAKIFQKFVPGAVGQPHVSIRGAGHFLQEDKPKELVEVIDALSQRAKIA